jgi:hypothetical protein
MKETHIRYLLFAMSILMFGPPGFSQCTIQNSDPSGICGPYNYPDVTGNNGNNVNVQMGYWNQANAPSGSTQTMYVTNPGSWYVDATLPTGNTAVETYPNSDAIYTEPLLSSYAYMYSSYAGDMNSNSNTSAEAAYDIWLNNGNNEVMIWTDISNRSSAGCSSTLAQVSFGGSYGVPAHLWDLWRCSSGEIVWQLDQQALGSGTPGVYGLPSGSADIYAMLTWLVTNGYLPSGTTIRQIEYGFEIASTGGVDEQFQVTGWSITDGAAAAVPGFTAGSGETSSITVTHGSSATGTISVVGTNGFAGPVALSCQVTTAIPSANDMPGCSLDPASVTISGTAAQTSTLTVTTTAAPDAANEHKRLFWPSAGGTALALVILFGVPKRRRNWLTIAGLLLLVVSCAVMGCGGGATSTGGGNGGGGGNSGTTPGTYTVTVTGTSGSIGATVGTVVLTVQ